MQDFYDSSAYKAQIGGATAKNMIDLNNISVWDFFENVSKSDQMDDPYRKNTRIAGSLQMAVSVRPPSESNRGKQSKSGGGALNPGACQQLHDMFKNDMINVNVLPKIKVDT